MADLQDDVHEELLWDLRALAAADLLTGERLTHAGVPMHLNLGEWHRKLGDLDRAREDLDRGRQAIGALGDNGFGRMVTGGLSTRRSASIRLTASGIRDRDCHRPFQLWQPISNA